MTDEDFAYFKPRPSVLIELARLAEIAVETKERLCGFLFGTSSRGGSGGSDGAGGGGGGDGGAGAGSVMRA